MRQRAATSIAMHDSTELVNPYLDAATQLMGMPLDAQRRAGVATNLLRIASFAANLADVALSDETEIAEAPAP